MRRVLLVHYHFLPVHNVAVKHLLGYARHLPACGWDPLVLTHDWTAIGPADAEWGLTWEPSLEAGLPLTIHRVAAGRRPLFRRSRPGDPWLLRKARTLANLLGSGYPDGFASWTGPAAAHAIALVRRQHVDAIVSYCPPETNLVVGSRVARATGVPWVPFFGDLYGFLLAPPERAGLGAMASRAYHRHWLAPAAACAAVSPSMVEYVTHTYGVPASLVLVGFEPDEFAGPRPAPARRDRLVVSHVGSLYPGNQRPEIFLDGLDRFLGLRPDAASRLAVRFVGSTCDDALRALVRGRAAEHVVAVVPKVPSTEAVAEVCNSDALLAFTCTAFSDRHGTLSYPSKVFEAFGARRPVLAMPPDGDWVDALLARTQGGVTAASPAEVAAVLGDWFEAWTRTGTIPYSGHAAEIATFTHERQAAALARVLDRAVAAGQRS